MKKPAQSESNLANHPVRSVYDQVAYTNELSTRVSETETDILSPGFQFSSIQPGVPAEQFIDQPDGNVHRIDPQHESVQTPHSDRLQKFIELSQQYAQTDTQPVSSSETTGPVRQNPSSNVFRATADWKSETRHQFVQPPLQPTKQTKVPVTKPNHESTLDSKSIKIRIDSGSTQSTPHFEVESNTTAPIPKAHISHPKEIEEQRSATLPWKVAPLQWPSITDKLLLDPSQTIQRIGENISNLLTGDQNQLLVSSTSRGEGVTTIAVSIARWARSQRRQVLLIDADLQNASLTSLAGLGGEVSWLDTVNNPRNVGDTIVQDQNTGLFLMPLAPMTDRSNLPSNIYQALGRMLELISDCFELVVMDVGPTYQFLNESSRVDFIADAALMVDDVTKTERSRFVAAKSNLLSAGICKMIVAENFTGGTQSV